MTSAAIAAFDALADEFDTRFGAWHSVAAQRRAVRRTLLRAFPPHSRLLELAGGTGEDALFLAERGRQVVLTDGAPAMVARARDKARKSGLGDLVRAEVIACEDLAARVDTLLRGRPPFDGAFSNFAGLNCVADLTHVGAALARLVRPGGTVVLVMFGAFPIGEFVTQLLFRRDLDAAFRRRQGGPVVASIGGRRFSVRYPTVRRVARELGPRFRLRAVRGIGISVPPSAAEPAISRFPRLVRALELADRVLERPLAVLGDHILLRFVRLSDRLPEGA